MLRQSKDEEILDRTAEVASAITEEGLRPEERASLIVFLDQRRQLHAGRQRRGERWRLYLDGQPPQN